MPDQGRSRTPNRPAVAWSRRGLLTAGAGAALTAGLTGCSSGGSGDANDKFKEKVTHPPDSLKEKGFPISTKSVTVKFMTPRPAGSAHDWNNVAAWKKYQKTTNIKIDWGLVPHDSLEEKRNLALSGGDYPEAFFANWLGVQDLGKYGAQGVFPRINDLIDEYMPNLKKLMADNADIKQGMTFPDGNVYGIPLVIDPEFLAMRIQYKPWVRADWLDKFDMDIPRTTDEFHRYLKTVKSRRPNGKSDSIPYGSFRKGEHLYAALRGSFAVGNRGQAYLDADPSDKDKLRFFPIADGYKALMEYMHKLYAEGLILKNIFSIDEAKARNAMSEGLYGSTVEIAPFDQTGGKSKQFVGMPSLKGPDGDHTYNNIMQKLKSVGQFVITDKCKHPVEMARWADYLYSDGGAKLQFMGVEGKSYKETGDGVEFVDEIKDPPKDKSQTEALKPYVTYPGGGAGPGIETEKYFKGAESSEQSTKAAKLLDRDAQQEIWPDFTFTQDEFEQLESLSDDIQKYVDETRDKFISGDVKLSEWDKYVKKIKKMGLDDYMEIQQKAYDRYRTG